MEHNKQTHAIRLHDDAVKKIAAMIRENSGAYKTYSYRDIANAMGVSIGAVANIARKVRQGKA